MAETTPDAQGQLTDEQIDAAMAQGLEGGEAPEPNAEAADVEEGTTGKAEADKGKQFDPEKFQQQNREVGNLKRTVQSLVDEIKSLKEKPTARQEDRVAELKDDLEEQISQMIDDGHLTPEVAKLIRSIKKGGTASGDSAVKQLKERLDAQDQELQTLKWERAFNEQFPGLPAGSYQRLSKRAFDQAVDDLGEDADPNHLQGAANGYLIRMAKVLSKNGAKGKPKSDDEVVDKTARNKPAGSTKGADIAKKGAAPAGDLEKMSDQEIMEIQAQLLNETPSLEAQG